MVYTGSNAGGSQQREKSLSQSLGALIKLVLSFSLIKPIQEDLEEHHLKQHHKIKSGEQHTQRGQNILLKW